MLSRLSPAARCVRLMTLPNPLASVVPSGHNGVWAGPEERAAGVAAFETKKAAAGIKNWNIVPQDVYDPVVKAGLGMIVDFQDFIPNRLQGKCSDAVLEQTLNIYTEMKADGAKAYQIKAALAPIFLEEGKAVEAARTDQVPRIRRFNFALDDVRYLYAGPLKKMEGTSYIQGSRLESALSYFNCVKTAAPVECLAGHAQDAPLMENVDGLINGILNKGEVWAHTGEPVLAMTHPAWTANFVFEAEDANGNTCSIPCAYPVSSSGYVSELSFSDDEKAALDAAASADEKHAIALAAKKSGYDSMLVAVDDVLNKNGDSRPNPTKNFLCRLFGLINGEGTPSQQVAKYQADQAVIDQFAGWQNEVGIYPASNSTLNDVLAFSSKRHPAKFNTQTIYGKTNFGRSVASTLGTVVLVGLL